MIKRAVVTMIFLISMCPGIRAGYHLSGLLFEQKIWQQEAEARKQRLQREEVERAQQEAKRSRVIELLKARSTEEKKQALSDELQLLIDNLEPVS